MALGWGIAWGMGVHRGDSPNIMILLTAIICENTTCLTINRWYHYDCVGIIEEPETWAITNMLFVIAYGRKRKQSH